MSSLRHLAVLQHLQARSTLMMDDLATLVAQESPSDAVDATAECAALVDDWLQDLLGCPPAEHLRIAGRSHLRWRFGSDTRVLLLAHLDTVWPLGTIARWPFSVHDGRASGPGAFDMKAGLVQLGHALSTLDDLAGVTVLVTSDEEIGSPTSRHLIEEAATGARAALVLEPSMSGMLKTARKGVSLYQLDVVGRAAHAGLEPERGANAALALARALLDAAALASPGSGTTVVPTVLSAGSTVNTVPETATAQIDVRAGDAGEQQRVDASLRRLVPAVEGTELRWSGGVNRPPMTRSASHALYGRAVQHAAELGLALPGSAAVGGGSDGNFTAGMGIPTLDGLGAVGDGAHAEGEHVLVTTMPQRAALLARLVDGLLRDGRDRALDPAR